MPKEKNNPKVHFHSGEMVKCGCYACEECNGSEPHTIYITSDNEKLPICPKCKGTTWMKV